MPKMARYSLDSAAWSLRVEVHLVCRWVDKIYPDLYHFRIEKSRHHHKLVINDVAAYAAVTLTTQYIDIYKHIGPTFVLLNSCTSHVR